jgi:hypothetical protein
MPSMLHEALVALFRNRPTLLAELLAGPLGVALPRYASVRVEPGDLGDVVPPEHHADLVLVLDDEAARAVLVVVLEAQLSIDADKRWSWPAYVAVARARHRCPALLVVVAVESRVAAFASRSILLGPAGARLHADLVLLSLGDAARARASSRVTTSAKAGRRASQRANRAAKLGPSSPCSRRAGSRPTRPRATASSRAPIASSSTAGCGARWRSTPSPSCSTDGRLGRRAPRIDHGGARLGAGSVLDHDGATAPGRAARPQASAPRRASATPCAGSPSRARNARSTCPSAVRSSRTWVAICRQVSASSGIAS